MKLQSPNKNSYQIRQAKKTSAAQQSSYSTMFSSKQHLDMGQQLAVTQISGIQKTAAQQQTVTRQQQHSNTLAASQYHTRSVGQGNISDQTRSQQLLHSSSIIQPNPADEYSSSNLNRSDSSSSISRSRGIKPISTKILAATQ